MVQDPTSFSASDPEQTPIVVDLLVVLRTRFTGTVRVICFYAGQAKEVGVALAEREMADVIVSTADGCQGHEADLAIVVTTKAGLTTVDGSGSFWNDERRVNVALSRGKFGMIVIWRCFLKKALEKTVAVTPDYIEVMAEPEAEYENGVLVGPNGTVRASNFYDEWKEHDSNISQEAPSSEFVATLDLDNHQHHSRQHAEGVNNKPYFVMMPTFWTPSQRLLGELTTTKERTRKRQRTTLKMALVLPDPRLLYKFFKINYPKII
uniref:DNA2/NAM7 helicase-like C-terminal domain-containing protein n=1 Tax=Meloidogyne enterolobii TaxID=390850 RepID=A0A6V7VBX7_MELEN|nr:unnamed protein product [Meloidogyne enterolobii]